MQQFQVRDNRGGGWFYIHNRLVRDYGYILRPFGIAVYAALALYAGPDQRAWPSRKTIARMLGMSPTSVSKSLALMRRLRIIAVEPIPGREWTIILTAPSEWLDPQEVLGPCPEEEAIEDTLTPGVRGVTPGVRGVTPGVRGVTPGVRPLTPGVHEQYPITRHEEQEQKEQEEPNLEKIWEIALQDLQGQLTRATFYTWLGPARLLALRDGTAVVEVASQYAAEWLGARLTKRVLEALSRAAGREITKIEWEVKDDQRKSVGGLSGQKEGGRGAEDRR